MKQSANRLISIILPVYNVASYLEQCLNSILNQTYSHIEVIAVNDGSTDGSLSILQKNASKDSRIRIINQENIGLSGARNTGLLQAAGEYIMFVDSDDWIDITICEKALSAALKYNSDLVFWSYIREFEACSLPKNIFNRHHVFEGAECMKLSRKIAGPLEEELKRPDHLDAIVTVWGKLYHSSLFKNGNILFVDTKEIGTEDALFNLEVFSYAHKIVYIHEFGNHYRKTNNNSLTSTFKVNLFTQWKVLFQRMEDVILRRNLAKEYKKGLQNRIALSFIGLGLNMQSLNWNQQRVELSKYLNDPVYMKAVSELSLQYFPIHWKFFFWGIKNKNYTQVILLLKMIHFFINRKNR